VIGHVPGGIRRVYDRFEYRQEKRQVLEQWCAYVDALVNPRPKMTSITEARTRRKREFTLYDPSKTNWNRVGDLYAFAGQANLLHPWTVF
jgi:hypothetical protein